MYHIYVCRCWKMEKPVWMPGLKPPQRKVSVLSSLDFTVGSLATLIPSSDLYFFPPQQTCSWPLLRQTVMERVTALIGSQYPVSKTPSVRPLNRLCHSWTMEIQLQHRLYPSLVRKRFILKEIICPKSKFIYSPSSCSKTVWISFFCWTQKISSRI